MSYAIGVGVGRLIAIDLWLRQVKEDEDVNGFWIRKIVASAK